MRPKDEVNLVEPRFALFQVKQSEENVKLTDALVPDSAERQIRLKMPLARML